MSPRDTQGGAVLDGRLADEVDERFELAMMLLRADQLLRDLGRLERAWRRYQRQHAVPLPGQLALF